MLSPLQNKSKNMPHFKNFFYKILHRFWVNKKETMSYNNGIFLKYFLWNRILWFFKLNNGISEI